MFFRYDCWKYEYHRKQIRLSFKWDLILNYIAYFDWNSLFILRMVIHLFLNEFDCLGGNITALEIEKIILSEQREQSITDSAPYFKICVYLVVLCMSFFYIFYLFNLSLQIIAVLKEVAFMAGVESIPNFGCFLFCLLVFMLWQKLFILLYFLFGLMDHLGGKLVQHNCLLGHSVFIKWNFPQVLIFLLLRVLLFLHL